MSANNTKIKYLPVVDKIYEVISIDWQHLYVEARETDLTAKDVPESEVFPVEEFAEFRVRLCNG